MPDLIDAAPAMEAVVTLDALKDRPGGYLEASGIVTRTGVFEYADPLSEDGSGVTMVLRHPDDVFAADSLATLERAPVTIGHPIRNIVRAESAKRMAVGTVSEARPDGKHVRAKITIWDADAIEQIRGGLRELSCGYRCDLALEAGEYNGQPYAMRQMNISYNHLAVVERGRAGPDARLTLDGADARNEEIDMAKIKIGDEEYEVPDKVADAFKAMEKKAKDAEENTGDAADISKLTAERDAARGRADGAEAALADAERARAEAVTRADNAEKALVDYPLSDAGRAELKARSEALAIAAKALGDEAAAKLDDQPTVAIQRAVISAKHEIGDDASADYVAGAFAAIAKAIKADDGIAAQRAAMGDAKGKPTADAADPVAAARQRYADNLGWKPEGA